MRCCRIDVTDIDARLGDPFTRCVEPTGADIQSRQQQQRIEPLRQIRRRQRRALGPCRLGQVTGLDLGIEFDQQAGEIALPTRDGAGAGELKSAWLGVIGWFLVPIAALALLIVVLALLFG